MWHIDKLYLSRKLKWQICRLIYKINQINWRDINNLTALPIWTKMRMRSTAEIREIKKAIGERKLKGQSKKTWIRRGN